MGFQTSFNQWMPKGLPGSLVSLDGFVPSAYTYLSDGTVQAGSFAFLDKDKGGYCTKAKADASLLGVVVRQQNTYTNVPIENATNTYPFNSGVTIAQRGLIYFKVPEGVNNVTHRQSLLCDPATGAVTFGAAGSPNDTGWIVELDLANGQETANEGDLIRIQNFG